MLLRTCLATALTLLATLAGATAQDSSPPTPTPTPTPTTSQPQPTTLRALDGEWTFVEDRTEGRALEQLGPPMASKFSMRVEEGGAGAGAVILNGHGSGHKDVRIALDGSITEITEPQTISRYRGTWKDGTFEYQVAFERVGGGRDGIGVIRRTFRMTPDGLLVSVGVDARAESIALYRHADDIPMPTPAKAKIGDIAWLAGAWVGTRGEGGAISIEERWSPPLGGAMLAMSRSVRAGRMTAFEYLRIVERDGGLVYIAQPGGAKGTEFILTELTATRAAFENPRHDYPKRIVYELSGEANLDGKAGSRLTATIGQLKGGTPRRFEFKREGS